MLRIKRFSKQQEPIDISHLSEPAQKRIIERERKKIELDQKIADTHDSLMSSRKRAKMSIGDNAKLGAYEIRKNQAANIASGAASYVMGGKAAEKATRVAAKLIPGIGDTGVEVVGYLGRVGGASIAPKVTELAGSAIGAVKGMTAESSAKLKERKLKRLIKKREALGE